MASFARPAIGAAVFLALMLAAHGLAWVVLRIPVMDLPDHRKAHRRPTPKSGGIGVIGGLLLAVSVFPTTYGSPTRAALAAALFLGIFGLLDDLRDRGPLTKLAAQVLAAVAVVIALPWPGSVWGVAAAIMAVVWLVFITNAFNFMDGLDGLAGGGGLVAALFLAAAAPAGGGTQCLSLALATGLAGFLPLNLAPARLFLGDSGSQFCGFLLGTIGLLLAAESADPGRLWLVPALLSGMIFDVGFTLARRWRAGERLTTPHRAHLYQSAPLPPSAVAAAHWGFVLAGGAAWFWLVPAAPWLIVPVLVLPQCAWLALARGNGVRIRRRSW